MTIDDYKRALDTACREFEQLTAQRAELDARIARLHESITALTRLCGYTPTMPWGLTDAMRVVLMRAEKPMTAIEVRDRLRVIGFDFANYTNDLSAVHTVLKRLHRAGEARFVARAPGNHAYQWASDRTVVFDQPHAHIPFEVFDARKPPRSKK